MNRRLFLSTLGGAFLASSFSRAFAQDSALFAQSASAALRSQFESGDLSWILMDGARNIIDSQWADPDAPVSPGSLLKPFVALAYAKEHNSAFPRVRCAGTSDLCWLPRGHGNLGLEDALAQSCNAYFLTLAGQLDIDRAGAFLARLGLAGPPHGATHSGLIGLASDWRETPSVLVRAYFALLASDQPTRSRIATGMQRSAQSGTAAAVDSALGFGAALAKTGTAACTHHPRATADGFAVVLYPAGQPRILLLLRKHAATGARTSAQAAAMLRTLGFGTS